MVGSGSLGSVEACALLACFVVVLVVSVVIEPLLVVEPLLRVSVVIEPL